MLNTPVPPFFLKGGPVGVLLIHGFTASPTEMRPLGDYLHQRGFTVSGICLAGHGTTPEEMARCSWTEWYISAESGLEELGQHVETIFVAGLSMGGILSVLLADRYGDKIRALSLLGPAFYLSTRILFIAQFLRYILPGIKKSSATLAYYKKHGLFSYPLMPTPALAQLHRLIVHGRKALRRIDHPTQIFLGSQDPTVPISAGARLFAELKTPHKSLVHLPNSHHILTVEPDTPALFSLVEAFIRQWL
jgi:carboxylesterase